MGTSICRANLRRNTSSTISILRRPTSMLQCTVQAKGTGDVISYLKFNLIKARVDLSLQPKSRISVFRVVLITTLYDDMFYSSQTGKERVSIGIFRSVATTLSACAACPPARSPSLHSTSEALFSESSSCCWISPPCVLCTVDRYCSPSKSLFPTRHPSLFLISLFHHPNPTPCARSLDGNNDLS
jgi:hypothetical protein